MTAGFKFNLGERMVIAKRKFEIMISQRRKKKNSSVKGKTLKYFLRSI
jgi:hypothetical protein